MISKEDVEEVRSGGNGSVKFIPAADDEVWQLSYFDGKFRVVKYPKGATIPLSARRVGGSAIPLPPQN